MFFFITAAASWIAFAVAYLIRHTRRSLGYSASVCSAQSNSLTTLPAGIFSSLTKLNELSMQCLPIQTLPADTFTPLASSKLYWCVPAPLLLRMAL